MSKLQITKVSIDVELSDKTYGNGTSSKMFLSAEPSTEKLTTEDAPTIIDQGLDLFMIAVETLMAGRLAVESITDEQYKSFVETAARRIKEVRAGLPGKIQAVEIHLPPIVENAKLHTVLATNCDTSQGASFVPLAEACATVGQTAITEVSVELIEERAAIQSERFYVKNGATNNAERLLALENWAYDGPPKDTTREQQLVKYALFMVPQHFPADIEKNGRLDLGKFKAAFLAYTPAERSDKLTLLEDQAAVSTPEAFRAWAQRGVELVWK